MKSRPRALALGLLLLVCLLSGAGLRPQFAKETARPGSAASVDELLESSNAALQQGDGTPEGASAWSGEKLRGFGQGLELFVRGASAPAKSRTLRVPQEFPSVQQAIEEAKRGDVVRVAAGEYREIIKMKDGVSVVGEDAATTVLDGKEKGGNVVTCQDLADPATRLENFTIRNAGASLSGILIEDSALLVNRNILLGNDYGIYIKGESSPVVQRNSFKENKVGLQVFNLETPLNSHPIVSDNLLYTNKKGISLYRGSALIEHNTVSFNSLSGDSGATFGVYLAASAADLRNNIITNNGICELCSGIYADADSAGVRIGFNDLWNNRNNLMCFGKYEMEDTNLSEDPLFVDALQLDLHLAEDSPLRGIGADKQNLGARL